MRKIKFEDFNDLVATKVFDSGGTYLTTAITLNCLLHEETTFRIKEWREKLRSSVSTGLDNILYVSDRDKERMMPDEIHSWSELIGRLIGHREYPANTAGLVYCECGISILYTVDEHSSISFMVFDELSSDIKKGIIQGSSEILELIPVTVNTNWIKYGMCGPIVSFVPFFQIGDFAPDIFSVNKWFSGPTILSSKTVSKELLKKLEKEYVVANRLGLFNKEHETFGDYRKIDPRFIESRQIAYDLERKADLTTLACSILLKIVFNPETETVVFTEKMADQYSRKHGTEKDESLIGITRIKDQTWMKEIIVDHPFGVCGHYRRLHNPSTVGKDYDGKPIQGLTWIKEFTKKGYHRRPQRDIEFEREDI